MKWKNSLKPVCYHAGSLSERGVIRSVDSVNVSGSVKQVITENPEYADPGAQMNHF